MIRTCMVAYALMIGSAPVMAKPIVSLGLTAGTLGIGPEIGIRGSKLGARADAAFLSLRHTFHSSDLDYAGRARLRSGGGTIDLYPFAGGFRISAGGRYNRNRARVTAMPNQPTSIGGFIFTPQQIGTLSGHGTVRDFAPSLSIGYGGQPRRGFALGIDAGAFFQGRVRVSPLTSSTGMIPQARLEAERADLQHDVDGYRVYPLLKVSAGYRF